MVHKKQRFLLFEIYDGMLFSGMLKKDKFTEYSRINIDTELTAKSSAQEELIQTISDIMKKSKISPSYTRLYWSICSGIDPDILLVIRNHFYTALGINLNIINGNTRNLYLNYSNNSTDSILCGVCKKEFQKVVICGSFRKHLKLVKEVYNYCKRKDIEVLSPKNVKFDSIFNGNFVLFHGEKITNERETYWIEHGHTEAIRDADAVVICNNEGYVGFTTTYEIGFAQALGKRIIFVNENCGGFDIYFPRDTGLLGF